MHDAVTLPNELDPLSVEQRRALLHLAVGEPMGVGEFADICTYEALEALEHLGLLVVTVDRRRLSIRFARPVLAEAIRRAMPPDAARTVSATLAESLRSTGARRCDDMTRLTRLTADTG